MMKRIAAVLVLGAGLLTACGAGHDVAPTPSAGHDHGHMHHPADGGPAPAGMRPAAHPAHPVGSMVTLEADHMPGMKGARARVVGVHDTVTYTVTYTPTTGGLPVRDHRWVVQEELRDAGTQRLPDGAHVVLKADHMPGMKGAAATIDSSTEEPVYMVDYEVDGMSIKNHKWVVESELR